MAPPDPRAFAEPIDIMPKLPSTLSSALGSSKWKERKEVLDELATLLSSTPRIKDSPELAEVAKSLATRIASDANINCVMVAAACMEGLANGMMSSFAKYREAVVPLMLERMKERKVNVTDSIGGALDAVFSTVGCLRLEFYVIKLIKQCIRPRWQTSFQILVLRSVLRIHKSRKALSNFWADVSQLPRRQSNSRRSNLLQKHLLHFLKTVSKVLVRKQRLA